jgi:two-component system nitrogen regulation response regulator NtrX
VTRANILIVDDEANILKTLSRALELEGFRVTAVASAERALAAVERGVVPGLALVDVALPGMDGLELLQKLKADDPELPVVMMSGHSTIETAVRATKLGAHDFVEKPLSTDRLLLTLDNALKVRRLREENADLRERAAVDTELLGKSASIRQILETVRKAAPTTGRVLVTGENGTGKELVARAIHEGSPRSDGPFVKVNCAAIPHDLIESELFGHEKGSFTGATRQRKGKFEQADGGTLFLDEIGDMSLAAQAKVLRALQEAEIERVGGGGPISVDVRVVSATNKTMTEEIAAGRFREDLFYRINVVPIEMPPLRARRDDIPLLAQHFLELAATLHGKPVKRIDQSGLTILMQHDWPGNVRELKNSMERLVILSEHECISVEEVSDILPAARRVTGHYRRGATLKDMVASAERDIVVRALDDNEGRVARTAEALGVERSHLYKKMKTLGIDHRAEG